MPTSPINTYSRQQLIPLNPGPVAHPYPVTVKPSQTITRGRLLGQVTATGAYAAYNAANNDGTEVARGISKYDLISDASGNIFFGTSGSANEQGQMYPTSEMFITGTFKTSELNIGGVAGVTTAALADLQARLISGSVTDGVMTF